MLGFRPKFPARLYPAKIGWSRSDWKGDRPVAPTQDTHDARKMPRRDFLTASGAAVLGASALGGVLPIARVLAQTNPTTVVLKAAVENSVKAPETLVKVLYDALSPKQREAICFAGMARVVPASSFRVTVSLSESTKPE